MRGGFTLIELLVVVTIIVVLLALLMPAMNKAIYQAELVECAGRLKALGTGVTVYAADHGRSYPYRPWVFSGARRPNHLWSRNAGVFGGDERSMIRPYVAGINKQVQCPFNKEMNLDQLASNDVASESNAVYSSYYLLYGWGYKGEKAMRKIGDRFAYDGDVFDVLASDYDMFTTTNAKGIVGSHPDQGPKALMIPYAIEDVSWLTFATGVQATGTIITISRWTSANVGLRAPIDMNFSHADGSVNRLMEVLIERAPGLPDDRMARLFEESNKATNYTMHLPPAR
jgi:prepilin-type N-terminal cleavage/methylation domain-containing protein